MEHTSDSKQEFDIIRGLSFGGLVVSSMVFIPATFFYGLVILVILVTGANVIAAMTDIEIPMLFEELRPQDIGFSQAYLILKVFGFFLWLVLWASLPVAHISSLAFGWVNFWREKYGKALKICMIPILQALILAISSSIIFSLE